MKLSEQQLNSIEKELIRLGVTFVDYKVEILDHIACEVEELCASENIDFEAAFDMVLKKWNPQLVKRDSLWLGLQHAFPKIIMQDISKRARQEKLISLVPMTIFFLCFAYFDIDSKWLDTYATLIKTVYFVLFGILILFYVKLNFKSVKTSHRFLFNQPFYVFLIFGSIFLMADGGGFLMTMYLLMMVFEIPFMLKNALRHERFVKSQD